MIHQVHNMLAIILDLHFKSSKVVENYVGHDDVFYFISKYNAKVVIFFLITVFDVHIKLIVQTCVPLVDA
jgi:hypothetical protein